MAGYIGSKTSVTQVDGYNRTEADDEFVNDPNSVITVSGSNVGIGTAPSAWRTAFPDYALDLGNRTALYDQWGGASFLANNFYRANDNALVYKTTDSASFISLDGDLISFSNAPSGTAGTAASFTERLRIDSSGRVTTPYQPAFRVNATLSHSLGSGWSTVGYDTNLTQRGNGYNTSTSIFTAPVAGWYHFSAALTFTGNTDADGTFAISINGSFSDLINSVSEPSTSGFTYNGHSVSGSAYLAANDNVRVVRYSTVTTVNRTSQEYGGWFSGYLIG